MPDARITSDPAILGGKPCIQGTRISVEFILELIVSGSSVGDIVDRYPHLRREDVEAAVRFAADSVRNTDLVEFEIGR